MTAAARIPRRLWFRPKLCFLGAPGSGKGSYGKLLAEHWGVPLISVSDILQQNEASKNAMSSGQLVDDKLVSQAIVAHLDTSSFHLTYLLDGFPRTLAQVDLMQRTWPEGFQIQAAVHLNVPLEVCERKLLGRRICKLCGKHYNIHGVTSGGFDLPAQLPRPGQCHQSIALGTPSLPQQHNLTKCDQSVHWVTRDDDRHDIIVERLKVYEEHTRPILDAFAAEEALFSFVPYKGYEDMPKFQSALEEWLIENLPQTALENLEGWNE